MNSTLRPAAVLMSGRLAGLLVAFCIPVVLARVLDQGAFGTYKQLFLVYATLYGIAQLGMAESLFYFLPADPEKAGRCALNSLLVLAVAGTGCFTVLWAGRARVAAWLGNEALAAGLPWIGLHLALMLASAGLEIVLISRKRFAGAAAAYAGSDVVRTALFLVPVLLFRNLEGLLIGAAAFSVLRLVATLLVMKREFGADLMTDRSLLRVQLAYAMPFEIYVLVEILQANLHQYAISLHFDPAAFAVYSVGCLQVPLVDLVAGSTCNVMMVKMAEDIRNRRTGAVLSTWHDTVGKLALVLFPMVGLLLVNARELIALLFTERYLASVPIFMVWTTAFLLMTLPVDGVMRAFADTRFLLLIGAVKLAIIAASIGWFIGRFGLLGGVLVTLLATLVGKTLALTRMRRHMNVGAAEILPWADLAAPLGCAIAAGLPALVVKEGLGLRPLSSILLCGLVYALAYAALIAGLRASRSRQRRVSIVEAEP
jgi:O-antigen/teichoic acid export membrane protein